MQVERVTKLAKSARSEMVQLTGTSDLDIEERVLHYFELRESLQEYSAILRYSAFSHIHWQIVNHIYIGSKQICYLST